MFEDYSKYPKERVKVFFKYLVNAAQKQQIKEKRPEIKSNLIHKNDLPVKNYTRIEERMINLTDIRKDELETKIKMHYTQNKFLPYETKLKKLKRQYNNMKRRKNHSKTKLNKIQAKVKTCEKILKQLKSEA